MSKILLVAPELAELAPVGGIAEFVYGLAGALIERGHDVRAALPAFDFLTKRPDVVRVKKRLVVRLGYGASTVAAVYKVDLDCPAGSGHKLPVLLFGGHRHFRSAEDTRHIYDWPNHEPWIVFSRAVVDELSSAKESDWRPDVIHCQDSHTALIPVFVDLMRRSGRKCFASEVRTVLTIHNLLNQGKGPPDIVSLAGLPPDYFEHFFEYWGFANCFKAGLLTADAVSTVSRTYKREICESAECGFGLEGVLASLDRAGKLSGIPNGIDDGRWAMDGFKYDGSNSIEDVLRVKQASRQLLFGQWGWQSANEPIVAFRGRWDNQKGVGLLTECLPAILGVAKVIVVTWPIPDRDSELSHHWNKLQNLAAENPQRILINPKGVTSWQETAAHYSVADYLLMPSEYEPCGLCQQECQRFGTIPIVRQTGGLADTVAELPTDAYPSPNGYVFREMNRDSMLAAVHRAVRDFQNLKLMHELIHNALLQKNGWVNRLKAYEQLYGIA